MTNLGNISESVIRGDQLFKVEEGVVQIAAKTKWQQHLSCFYKAASPLQSIHEALEKAIKADEYAHLLPPQRIILLTNIARINQLIVAHNESYSVYFFGGRIKPLVITDPVQLSATAKSAGLGRTLTSGSDSLSVQRESKGGTEESTEFIKELQGKWDALHGNDNESVRTKRDIISQLIEEKGISNDQLFNFFSKNGINFEVEGPTLLSGSLIAQFLKKRGVNLYTFLENQTKLPIQPYSVRWNAIKSKGSEVRTKFLTELLKQKDLTGNQVYDFFVANEITFVQNSSKGYFEYEGHSLDLPDNIHENLKKFLESQTLGFIERKQVQWEKLNSSMEDTYFGGIAYSQPTNFEILGTLIANKNVSNSRLLDFFKKNHIHNNSEWFNVESLENLKKRGIIKF